QPSQRKHKESPSADSNDDAPSSPTRARMTKAANFVMGYFPSVQLSSPNLFANPFLVVSASNIATAAKTLGSLGKLQVRIHKDKSGKICRLTMLLTSIELVQIFRDERRFSLRNE
ncbi:12206_t:CDS:2, partial [Acaulospora colombiana]